MNEVNMITVQTTIEAPINTIWEYWTLPEHIVQWNQAAPEWHCPKAEIDLTENGKFNYRMEAKDGSYGFDLSGHFTAIQWPNLIEYSLADERKVTVSFTLENEKTQVQQKFEPEQENSIELQEKGWQAILDNFKLHVESK